MSSSKHFVLDSVFELGIPFPETGGTHDRYCCPFCFDVRGKEDEDFKLHVHKRKKIGFCFKCTSVVTFGKTIPKLTTIINIFLKYLREVEQKDTVKPEKEFQYTLSLTTPLKENKVIVDYLNDRGVSQTLSDYWEIRALNLIGRDYVFFYDKSKDGFINYYQTRAVDKKERPKYNSGNAKKPLVKLHKHRYNDLILVEGIFDALAVGRVAIPIMGKYLSNIQKKQLYLHHTQYGFPKRIYICLDGGCEEYANKIIVRLRRNYILHSRIYRIDLPVVYKKGKKIGLDPEEVGEDFNEYFEKAKRIV